MKTNGAHTPAKRTAIPHTYRQEDKMSFPAMAVDENSSRRTWRCVFGADVSDIYTL
jgi:hypothetical protein